ncbi:MAG: diaminobutyrate acetyltransferase [Kofleriaceae bacterium]
MISLRSPKPTDAAAIWKLLEALPELERNTCYAYVVLCADFADSCVVAEDDAQNIVGFVIGYVPPRRPDEVFVWQVGVARSARGAGLGARMLDHVARSTSARFLTATVSPDNEASRRLFRSFARRREASCAISAGYPAELFAAPHQPEELMRIGPLTLKE